jgi:hypothetical protein
MIDFDYLTVTLLLLSLCLAYLLVVFGIKLFKIYCQKTDFIEHQYGEVLSLLIFPSTYQEGLQRLQQLRPYKHYLALMKELVTKQRQSGGNFKKCFEDLRLAVHRDTQWENEQRQFLKESCFQYMGYMFFTWLLCALFAINHVQLSLSQYFLIAIMHVLGVITLFLAITKYQLQLAKNFEFIVPQLYRTMVSSEGAINFSEQKIRNTQHQKLCRFQHALKNLVTKRNSFGVSITAELQLLAEDFWFTWEQLWQETKRRIQRLKATLIMVVFGGAFVIILYGISQRLIAGMFEQNLL